MDFLNRHFGLVIAYLLPGFVALAGIAPLVPMVAGWLDAGNQTASLGAPLYALLAATAAGMVVSCFRWLLIDRIHAVTGLGGPAFNARALEERPGAVLFLLENHYRFHLFYANTLVAVIWTYVVHRRLGTSPRLGTGTDVAVVVLCAVLFAGSRDALAKYRNRIKELVGQVAVIDTEADAMTNGADHNQGGGGTRKAAGTGKSATKPKSTEKPEQKQPVEKQVPKPSGS